jgi:uncharacterized SAM-binding protein YcdF (DUF218 family)
MTASSLLGFGLAVVGQRVRVIRRTGWALLGLGLAGFGAVFFFPVHVWALRPLEDRFPPAKVSHVDGIVVLGGGITVTVSADRSIPTLNRDADRLTAFAALARAWPDARLVYAGGPAARSPGHLSEAAASRELFRELGMRTDRILFDDRSLTTWGNAIDALALARPKPGETWLLVTSASHMPRAMGAFRAAGWPEILPWPVAYRTTRTGWPPTLRPMGNKLAALDLAAHEWEGLVVYWWEGRIHHLFPAP